ncbi:nucleotidyltransferase family protein [Aminicella lysinilytica]|uniref:nucleotidyltransferase family protein n=1 Tax=Aminicella lysinilytica TaxID=433323 RepID=UPI0026F34283|nr:sugar phosphate nucleotidyltransferase [Aminicella lysinilytica]
MNKPTLVIMAAGMGSRYGGLKQIDPVGDHGEIILDFSLYDAMMAGFEKVIFIIKKENEKDFHEIIDGRAGKHLQVEYAFQELADLPEGYQVPEGRQKPWGTCHAVLSARDLIDGPFAVINADDYYGPGAFSTIYDFLETAEDKDKYDYAMVGYELSKTLTENGYVSRGVCRVADDGSLASVTERTKIMWRGSDVAYTDDDEVWTTLPKDATVSMNFWGFTESMVREMQAGFPLFLDKALAENPLKGEYFLPSVVSQLIDNGKARVRVLKSRDQWYGVTYKEDKEAVVSALQAMKDKGLYPEILWK